MEEFKYKAVARAAYGAIAQGTVVDITSQQQVERSSGLTFRREIAEACRSQLGVDIMEDEEARLATNFDVYDEIRFAEILPKLEAAAQKEREKAEKAAKKAASGGKRKTSKKKQVAGGFSMSNLKKWGKVIVGIIVVTWFVLTQIGDCENDAVRQAKNTIEEMTKTSSTRMKKTSAAKKKSSAKKAAATKKKKTVSTKKKSTSSTKKSPSSSAKKKSTVSKKKKSTSK